MRCGKCIHARVCTHLSNINNGTYAYMGIHYDTKNCSDFIDEKSVINLPMPAIEQLRIELTEYCRQRCYEEL